MYLFSNIYKALHPQFSKYWAYVTEINTSFFSNGCNLALGFNCWLVENSSNVNIYPFYCNDTISSWATMLTWTEILKHLEMPPFLLKGFTLRPTCMFRQLGREDSIIPLPPITNNLTDQSLGKIQKLNLDLWPCNLSSTFQGLILYQVWQLSGKKVIGFKVDNSSWTMTSIHVIFTTTTVPNLELASRKVIRYYEDNRCLTLIFDLKFCIWESLCAKLPKIACRYSANQF